MEGKTSKERAFSVELNSRADLKNVALMNGWHNSVIVEGTLGALVEIGFNEGIIFEVIGEKGILRIDLTEDEVTNWKKITTPDNKGCRR